MSYYFWMYPFIYLFWPKPVKMVKKNNHLSSSSNADKSDEYTEYVESDDEIESVYPSELKTSFNRRSLVHNRTFVRSLTDPERSNRLSN